MALIAVGMFAAGMRGSQMFDIDFTGGTSLTFMLNDSSKMPIAEVRNTLRSTELNEKNLLVVERGETNTRYSIDTSEQSVDRVKEVVQQAFGDKLLTYVRTGVLTPWSGTALPHATEIGPGHPAEEPETQKK